ncbi:hypothetical protein GCM10023191_098200 [Actinoallomurus oryzae]|uniref:Uncharacterized protein n=1 Tax=Actinoallomurus oryzae TaxID=502180 RepID=A0ABP8R8E9_9ACTN
MSCQTSDALSRRKMAAPPGGWRRTVTYCSVHQLRDPSNLSDSVTDGRTYGGLSVCAVQTGYACPSRRMKLSESGGGEVLIDVEAPLGEPCSKE